jgi:hypothetical protein
MVESAFWHWMTFEFEITPRNGSAQPFRMAIIQLTAPANAVTLINIGCIRICWEANPSDSALLLHDVRICGRIILSGPP